MKTSTLLRRGRNLLRSGGIVRGQFMSPSGRHCSIGALRHVLGDWRHAPHDPEYMQAVRALMAAVPAGSLPPDLSSDSKVSEWWVGSYHDRTATDAAVFRMWDKAIETAELEEALAVTSVEPQAGALVAV